MYGVPAARPSNTDGGKLQKGELQYKGLKKLYRSLSLFTSVLLL